MQPVKDTARGPAEGASAPLNILYFFAEQGSSSRRAVIGLIVVSGLASGVLLAVVNAAAQMASQSQVQLRFFLLFVAVFALFVVTKRIALQRASRAAEAAICNIRTDLSEKLRHSQLLFVEEVGRSNIYARLTQDTSTISQSMPVVFNGYQSAVVILAGLIYILTISVTAFVLTVVFLGLGGVTYLAQAQKTREDMVEAIAKETEFFDALGHLVDGFKEIKINRAKNDAVFARVRRVSQETMQLMTGTATRYANHLVTAQAFIYLAIAVLVFALPALEFSNPATVLKLTASVLFIVGPIEIVAFAFHMQSKATVALNSISDLQQRLSRAGPVEEALPTGRWNGFETLALSSITFNYPGTEHSFQIGPISLSIPRGGTTFIVGGNGSGKSTLLKVLTGLYEPSSGRIMIDRTEVSPAGYCDYRELFACIFSDFHLFDRFYGQANVDPDRVQALLKQMELSHKTRFENGRFTNLDLSTGQRKRLALIAALIEDKPIYIFDEWAADQDPSFRKYFYDVILPDLKAAGKTVIAVTHDDRYFDRCDQLIKLDYGEIVPQ